MLSARTICSLLLLSLLWVDMAMAGSSFLSPEHQKAQRKEAKKLPAKLQPRALGGQDDGAEDKLQIRKHLEVTRQRLKVMEKVLADTHILDQEEDSRSVAGWFLCDQPCPRQRELEDVAKAGVHLV